MISLTQRIGKGNWGDSVYFFALLGKDVFNYGNIENIIIEEFDNV